MACGQQLSIPIAPHRHQETQHLFGAYAWATNTVTVVPKPAKKARHFIDFLEYLFMEVYPHDNLVLVIDNAPFHHSHQVKAFLSVFEHRVRVFWLPPYSPDLNLIERFWKHLKDHACPNKLFPTLDQVIHNVQRLVTAQNRPGDPSRILFSNNFH